MHHFTIFYQDNVAFIDLHLGVYILMTNGSITLPFEIIRIAINSA